MAKVSRKELAVKVADNLGENKTLVTDILRQTFSVMKGEIGQLNDLVIQDFGTFSHKISNARKGVNPRTGEPLDIPASATCKFKISKNFKRDLN